MVLDDFARDFMFRVSMDGEVDRTATVAGTRDTTTIASAAFDGGALGLRHYGATNGARRDAIDVPHFQSGGMGFDMGFDTRIGHMQFIALGVDHMMGFDDATPGIVPEQGTLVRNTVHIGDWMLQLDAGSASRGVMMFGAFDTDAMTGQIAGGTVRYGGFPVDVEVMLHHGRTAFDGALQANTTDQAWRVGVGGNTWGLSVYQPLRSTGSVTWSRPVGRRKPAP